MIAARAAAYVVGIAAAVSLIFVEVGVESLILAAIVLAAVLIVAWSHGVFTREPRPPRPVSSYLERPATPEERAAWSAASPFFDQDAVDPPKPPGYRVAFIDHDGRISHT